MAGIPNAITTLWDSVFGTPSPVVGSASQLAASSSAPPPSAAGSDSVSQSNYTAAQLRQCNTHLIALEQMLAQNVSANPNFVQTMSGPIQNARSRYTKILQAYIYAYGTAFGSAPDTTGLEQWQIYVAAGVGIAAIAAAAYELYQYITGVLEPQAQAQVAATQNATYAMNQAKAAQQAGDSATAAQWLGVAQAASNAGAKPPSTIAWFEENWPWLAAAAAGLILLPKLIDL